MSAKEDSGHQIFLSPKSHPPFFLPSLLFTRLSLSLYIIFHFDLSYKDFQFQILWRSIFIPPAINFSVSWFHPQLLWTEIQTLTNLEVRFHPSVFSLTKIVLKIVLQITLIWMILLILFFSYCAPFRRFSSRRGSSICRLYSLMADPQGLEGTQPVDLSKHPSGIVPTLQLVFFPSE